ncbi:MAG: CARDB domain-containing protein [Candidatus Woesearchaeota archaeon]
MKNKLKFIGISIIMLMLISLVPIVFAGGSTSATDVCTENDNGLNYDLKGYAAGNKEETGVYGTYYDSCGDSVGDKGKTKGVYIAEEHCSSEGWMENQNKQYVHTQWYECEFGCENGACLTEPKTTKSCSDSDSGIDIYKFGKVVADDMKGYLGIDYCGTNDNYKTWYVAEHFCNNGELDSKIIDCPAGCSNGACLLETAKTAGKNLPDLTIKGITFENSMFKAEVCNNGDNSVSNFQIQFKANGKEKTLLYVPVYPAGKCNSIYSWGFNYFFPDEYKKQGFNPADYKVEVILDPNNYVSEIDEGNNYMSRGDNKIIPITPIVKPVVDTTNGYTCVDVLVDSCQHIAGAVKVWRADFGEGNFHILDNTCRYDPEHGWKDYKLYCQGNNKYKACSKPCTPNVVEAVQETPPKKLALGQCNDPDGFNPKVKAWAVGYNAWNKGQLSWGDHCTATEDGAQQDKNAVFLHEAICLNTGTDNFEVRYAEPVKCKYGCEDGVCLGDGSYNKIVKDAQNVNVDKVKVTAEKVEHKIVPLPPALPKSDNYFEDVAEENIVKDGLCDGCIKNNKCLPLGTRLVNGDGETPKYCNIDSSFEIQKSTGSVCSNSFECKSNFCSNNKCLDIEKEIKQTQNMLERIMNWISKWF